MVRGCGEVVGRGAIWPLSGGKWVKGGKGWGVGVVVG